MALVGQWLLASMDGSGVTPDASGGGHSGTVKPLYPSNMPAIGDGPCPAISGGMVFDGVDDYVDVGLVHTVGNVYSIAAWAKINSLTRLTIYSAGNAGACPTFGGSSNNNGALELATPGVFNDVSNPGAFAVGKWVHVVYSRASTAHADRKFFVNGAEFGMAAQSDVTHVNNTANTTIGCRAAGLQNWSGGLADVRLYSTALTAAEVYGLYQVSLRENALLLGLL